MKYIVPQDLRINVGIKPNKDKLRVIDFISKNQNLRIIDFAKGSVLSVNFDSVDDFISGWNRLHRGENSVHIGRGRKSIDLMIFRS